MALSFSAKSNESNRSFGLWVPSETNNAGQHKHIAVLLVQKVTLAGAPSWPLGFQPAVERFGLAPDDWADFMTRRATWIEIYGMPYVDPSETGFDDFLGYVGLAEGALANARDAAQSLNALVLNGAATREDYLWALNNAGRYHDYYQNALTEALQAKAYFYGAQVERGHPAFSTIDCYFRLNGKDWRECRGGERLAGRCWGDTQLSRSAWAKFLRKLAVPR